MKKILLIATLLFSFNSFAYKEVVGACLMGYLIPSVAQLDGADIVGTTVCSSAAAYYLFEDSKKEQVQLRKDVDSFIKESREDIKTNFETSQKNYGYYQEIIRDTVDQKFGEFDEDIKESIRNHIDSKEFRDTIRRKIRQLNKKEQQKHLKALEGIENNINKKIEKKVDLKLQDLGVMHREVPVQNLP